MMTLLAVITKHDVILRILSHVNLPRTALSSDATRVAYFDVTGESVPQWAVGVDPDPYERGPPADYDGVDPPGQEE